MGLAGDPLQMTKHRCLALRIHITAFAQGFEEAQSAAHVSHRENCGTNKAIIAPGKPKMAGGGLDNLPVPVV